MDPRPELILTDYEMPELDGAGLCQAAQGATRSCGSIPSPDADHAGRDRTTRSPGSKAGADDYIEKPKGSDDFRVLCADRGAPADRRPALGTRRTQPPARSGAQEVEFELELARKVQFALMPRPPKPRGVLRVAVRYTPANQLGGDVYDFYRLENNRLGILVADVSGHGVNSAMLSGMVKALGGPALDRGARARRIAGGAGCGGRAVFPRGLLLHGVLPDRRRGDRAAPLRGGRPPAGDRRRARTGHGRCNRTRGCWGSAWSTARPATPTGSKPGESLVIYTDGLTDAMDPSDTLFGEERLKTLLQSHHGADPTEILNQVDDALNRHTSPGTPGGRHQHHRSPAAGQVIAPQGVPAC